MIDSSVEESKIRTFFALRLRDSIARQLANCADSLALYDKKVEVDWVESDNYHLTLCFLGELTISKVEELTHAAKKYLSAEPSLNIHLEGIESYQSASNWTLLVAKTSRSAQLEALQCLVETLVKQAGVTIPSEGFRPHITLGRLGGANSFNFPQHWPQLDLISLADAVVLFQSKRGERGSVYTPLATIELCDLA